jgi:hypothetical protein
LYYPVKCRLQSRPQEIGSGDEAQGADDEHPDPGDDVDAAFGEGSDPALLAPPSAHEGVGACNEARHTREREQKT